MQQHVRDRANIEKFRSGPNLLGRAHTGRDDERLSGRSEFRQQRKIGQIGGGDLVGLDAERLQRCNAARIPWRAEVLNPFRRAIRRDAALLVGGQLEAAQQVEGVFDGKVVILPGQAGGAVDLRSSLRIWNFAQSAPAMTAASTSAIARSKSPL